MPAFQVARLSDQRREITAESIDFHVHTRASQADGLERRSGRNGVEITVARSFYPLKSKAGQLRDRPRKIFGDMITHRPELHGYRQRAHGCRNKIN